MTSLFLGSFYFSTALFLVAIIRSLWWSLYSAHCGEEYLITRQYIVWCECHRDASLADISEAHRPISQLYRSPEMRA